MAFPKITDFVTYINRKLTGNDWNTNFQKIVNWLSLGDTDIKVKSVEADSIKYNGTTIVQNGNINTNSITANTVTSNSFIGDGSQLTNIKAEVGFPYIPFTVNSAKVDSSGKGIFIDYSDTSKLVFLVDEENPLVITTAKGKRITITSINDYDVSGLNGSYFVFADEETNGGTVYLKSCLIYRQVSEPTGNNGDVWLDMSCEPYICREKVTSDWYNTEYNKVPIAKVVVTGGTITSLKHLVLNNNYVNPFIVESYADSGIWFTLWSNGYLEQGGFIDNGSNVRDMDKTITFLVPYSDTKYIFNFTTTKDGSSYCVGAVGTKSKTTTSITASYYGNESNNARYLMWKAEGYLSYPIY